MPSASFFPTDARNAASIVDRVVRASMEERIALLTRFEAEGVPDGLFDSIAEGTSRSADEFEKSYTAWLGRHPEWRGGADRRPGSAAIPNGGEGGPPAWLGRHPEWR